MQDLYAVLGVEKDASLDAIKKAYRAAVLELHPDRNPDPSASDKFIEVEEAYSTLSDEERRRDYDFSITPRPIPPPTATPNFHQQPPFFTMRGFRGAHPMKRPTRFATHARVGWTLAMCPLCAGREVIRSFQDGKFVVDPCPKCRYNQKTP